SFAMRCTVPVPMPSDLATFKIPTPFASCAFGPCVRLLPDAPQQTASVTRPRRRGRKSVGGTWRLTKLGGRLRTASLYPRIPRAKAEQVVAELVERAGAINRNPEMLFYVRKLTVFGSYLTKRGDLSDDLDEQMDYRHHSNT